MPQKPSDGHIKNQLSKGDMTFIANLELEMGKKLIENGKSFIDSGQME